MLESIDQPELIEHLHLTGYVNHDWLPGLYAMAEVFLYPSLRESFGIPIIEAMACGTLVITSNTSSMPEVAGGCALICDPYDVDSITTQLLKATSMTADERHELEAASLEHTRQFRWERTAREQLNIYRGTQVQFVGVG
jgi:glycosyltransferase involved in cell wall biosynthesis